MTTLIFPADSVTLLLSSIKRLQKWKEKHLLAEATSFTEVRAVSTEGYFGNYNIFNNISGEDANFSMSRYCLATILVR